MRATIVVALAVAVLLVLAAATLYLLGGRKRTFRAEVRIDGSADEVWPWLVEPERLERWIGGLVESRPLGDGGLRVGARSVETIEEGDRRSEMTTEVVALDPARLLAVRLESGVLTGRNRLELWPAGDGATLLRQTLTVRYRGAARMFGPFLGGTVRRKLDADLDRLRASVESGRRGASGAPGSV